MRDLILILSVLFRKRFVFIETFGRANMPTVAGRLMEKSALAQLLSAKTEKQLIKNNDSINKNLTIIHPDLK